MLFVFFCLNSISGETQIKFYTVVSEQEIRAGQTFQVQYIAEGASEIQDFNVPRFTNLNVHYTFDSKSTSFQSPGSQLTEAFSKIVVLSGKKSGRFIIPGATAMINGKRMKSNSLIINIVARGFSVITPEPAEAVPLDETSILYEGEKAEDKTKKNLFVKASVNKRSCYAGEAILLTYKLYSRVNNNSQILKRPSLPGLSVVEMVDSYDGKPEIENLDGRAYYVNLVRKVQGFPLQPGIIDLDIAEISSVVHFIKTNEKTRQRYNNINDLLSRTDPNSPVIRSSFEYPITLRSQSLAIDVKPLPLTNQPADFSGAVGRFTLSIESLQKEIHPGDLAKIRVTIKGSGNIPLLLPPDVRWPKGVDTAEPMVKEEFNKYLYPLQGFKSFEYSFAAPDTGTYIIPATSFYYFNPASQTYQVSVSDELKLKVTPGPIKDTSAVEAADVMQLNKERIPRQLYWFAVVVIIILGWVGYQFWHGRKAESPEVVAKPTANEEVVDEDVLKSARTALQLGNIISFYHELERSLWIVIANACEVLPSALNKQNVSAVLGAKGMDAETIHSLKEVLNECEWALYVPSHETRDAENLLERTSMIIAKINAI